MENKAITSTPPDGGYGWIVVLASFVGNYVVDGIQYSFGVLLQDLVTHFDSDFATVSLAGGTVTGVFLSIGIVTTTLVTIFGCRPVYAAGSLLAALAMAASIFSPNIHIFIFLYGILGGIGHGFITMSGILLVSLYFEKRRALAIGIARSGSSTGSMVVTGLGNYICTSYGWKAALWTYAGHCLVCFVASPALRPLNLVVEEGSSHRGQPDSHKTSK